MTTSPIAQDALASWLAEGITEFHSADPRLRDQARRSGWSGPLRGWLRHDGAVAPASIPDAVAALVPAVTITATTVRRRGLRSLVRAAVAGMPDTAEMLVHDQTGLRPFTVRYPDRPELFVEELARAVEVATAMRSRFGTALAHVRLVAVDLGPQGFVSGHHAGQAAPTVGDVHLNASLFLPDPRAELQPIRAARSATSGAVPSAPADAYTSMDGTTAHEFWHQIELAFTARDYTASIAFRRDVGAYFGVDTIEHAVMRPGPAHEQLVQEVSRYGATAALEATAEMAKRWWCGNSSPVTRHFGQVVDRFFPIHRG